ncbi:MAG TPA: hypothetical protein ENK57_10290, partial [Polyangiaceae bacterium]|nr:hypothetical protein [Polyangiaceae bacterium]
LLDTLGLFRLRDDAVHLRSTALFQLEGESFYRAPIVTVPLALLVATVVLLVRGVDALPIAVALSLPILLLSALRRPALMVVVIGTGLLLPFLGAYGLWDPWETHYGEVAREMLARDDWISLWWAQEDFFMSKPILIFWMEALSMGALGVDFHSDANPLHPELAIRLPHFLMAIAALLGVYSLVSRVWTKRAGLLAAIVLATMPHFFLISHQAITDLPFVTNMTLAMCMFAIAISTDPEQEVTYYRAGPITLSARHLIIGAITLVVVPQILYLISLNISFLPGFPPFGWHADVFVSGSVGNSGVPGNSAIHNVDPYFSGVLAQPISQAMFWVAGYLVVLLTLRKQTRVRALLMSAFYLFCGLAFMAKGIPGFALPGLVALFFLIGTRRWKLLLSGDLKVTSGIVTVLTVGMPWYVAMFIRHGAQFTNRLLVHDHLNRLTSGVHGDNASIEYFIEQMGYGMFPWIGLVPLGLAAWFVHRQDETEVTRSRRDVMLFAGLWMVAAFTLFSAMTTKFHHYIFPAVPPAAILVGLAVDRLLRPASHEVEWRRVVVTGLAVLSPIPAVLGVAGRFGDVRGVTPETAAETTDWVILHPWSTGQTALLLFAGCAMLAGAYWIGQEKKRPKPVRGIWAKGAMTTGLLAAPPVLALVGRDLSWVTDARPQGYERLIHLFVYNYGRPWPTEFDYRPILTGFAIVGTALILIAAIRPVRDVAMRAFVGFALMFCVWSLDVYMIDLSPHWGQRELVQRYYDLRESDEQPLVAWQMNWKGENFYTGNAVNVFVQLDNQALRSWLDENQGRTAFFLLEPARLASLRGVMRDSEIEEITDTRFCNKFILIRAHIGRSSPTVRDVRE